MNVQAKNGSRTVMKNAANKAASKAKQAASKATTTVKKTQGKAATQAKQTVKKAAKQAPSPPKGARKTVRCALPQEIHKVPLSTTGAFTPGLFYAGVVWDGEWTLASELQAMTRQRCLSVSFPAFFGCCQESYNG